ncbi:glycosyltransferase family 4 protein [Rheinheimera hassiensis]|uniref:glycosyltransferase family 4 protein n=1 Tax=Rheinheimera hassiensis TaxID=1193627 RepID=UPI001F050C09|nr:glycosyltransferase family 4 protein [Rheinheimera hassiensis]
MPLSKVPLLIIIGYVWPEPNSSAAGYRMLSLIKLFLARGWQVTFASAAEPGQHRYPLAELGVTERSISLNDSSFDQWISQSMPAAVMFDRFMLEEQFGWRVEQACAQALRILDMEDCHALRDARQHSSNAGKEMAAEDLNSELALREIAAIYRCDITLVISEFELQLLQQHYQVSPALLCYCPFLLDELPLTPGPDFAARQHFIAIGNFRHAPNWHSVLWLKQEIWPLVRQQLPQAELHIYGAYPPPKATALHNAKQGFLIKGWADDALAVMQHARVCLAPLAFGAGLKGKLLDAMRCGTPNVTTAVGAEGMTLEGDWGGVIAQDSNTIAQAAVALYQQPELWHRLQTKGFDIVQKKFSLAQHESRIWHQLNVVMQDLQRHRQANFTGLMLRHHNYRSTKFMGQWIEVKTRLAALTQPD